MADYTRQVKELLSENGCYFARQGKGDHEIWFSPIIGKPFTVDGSIKKRTSANKTLKNAGVNEKV
ncbi:MAG: type II toxin-antitoxin system HicA family toxin [Defluviitaleaceae bacterium]|nr:type II toxin-antitoxin system HicA family toxin [Defluviitaleaceae bacterium]